MLALRSNEIVPVERLIDGIWGEQPPESSVNLVQTYVSLWRRLFDEEVGAGAGRDRLVRVGAGYRLIMRPGELDLEEFRRLSVLGRAAARDGRWGDASVCLGRATALWGNEVLADLRREPFHAGLGTLEQERRASLCDWAYAALEAGDAASIIGALQESLDRDPMQEPVAALLVEALHELDRSAEALSVFESTRRVLAEQLGSSPGPRLAEVHLRVLRQEPRARSAQVAAPLSREPLPVWLDTFVGREVEVAELVRLIETHRLVTVTGPGGAGKTRLVVEVANRLAVERQTEVSFVDATVLSDGAQLPRRVAAALGIDVLAGETPERALREVMADRDALVIADNLEHLPGVGAHAERLVASIPGLRLLATSRSPLGSRAEHRYPLRPLNVLSSGTLGLVSAPSSGPAVTLFADRASAVNPDFSLDSNHAITTEICRRLDGLPLAIELAAGWCATLSLPSLLTQLDRTLELLVAAAGSARPDRQATLRATIQWSYDLLDLESRRTLRLLSVFRGGCSLDAAAAVCGDGPATVLPQLRDLVERGLLVSRTAETEDPRFEMLFTVRDYALTRLSDDTAEERVSRGRHAEYFLELAQQCSDGLHGTEQARHLNTLHAERDNIYEAIAATVLSGDIERAMTTASKLWRFWQLRSHLDEGRRLLQMLNDQGEHAATPAARGWLLLALGSVHYWQLAYQDAHECYERAGALFAETKDVRGQAEAEFDSGFALVFLDRLEEGGRRFESSEQRYHELHDPRGVANAVSAQALAHFLARAPDRATDLALRALEALRVHGDPFEIANTVALVGTTMRGSGRLDEAELRLKEALASLHAIGSVSGVAWVLAEMSGIAYARGDVPRAALLAGAVASVHDKRHPMIPMERMGLHDMRSLLAGQPEAEDQWQRGRELTIEQAIAAVLETQLQD
jgi:predicted ATPase/DNA-binding SARP family transcriptional activator